jgi:hypothetical protein
MTWPTTPDAALTRLRDQMVAAATTAGMTIPTGQVHYPTFAPGVDTLPALHVETFRTTKVPFANGAAHLPNWQADVLLLVERTTSASEAERLADAFLSALSAQQDGHLWQRMDRADATNPTAASEAAAAAGGSPNYRAVPMTIAMGVEA